MYYCTAMTYSDTTTIPLSTRLHSVEIDKKGTVTVSDHSIFDWKIGSSVRDLHPFFFVLEDLQVTKELKEIDFPRVHLEKSDGTLVVCDINLRRYPAHTLVQLHDYTTAYREETLRQQAYVKKRLEEKGYM